MDIGEAIQMERSEGVLIHFIWIEHKGLIAS